LREELARRRPQVLHVHGHTLGLLLEREMRQIPTVLSLDATVWDWHAMGIWRDNQRWSRATLWPSLALERRAFAAARSITAYTHWTADGVRRELPDARVVQLHPGINIDRYRPGPRAPRERPRVLFVGGRFEAKGGPELIDAARPLLARAFDLDVVTPAPVPSVPGVRLHRFAPNDAGLVALFQQADIFVLPTHGDVAPWVVLEAMACGVAVVAYDVGAIAELLDGGRAGLLVREGRVDELRGALERLAESPELRAQLGDAARARVEECYDTRRQNPKILDLLRRTAHEGPTL
jgi:glycosyltransferase involved in cell wall biosynthesis